MASAKVDSVIGLHHSVSGLAKYNVVCWYDSSLILFEKEI